MFEHLVGVAMILSGVAAVVTVILNLVDRTKSEK
jgi:hypothetical protein